MRRTFTPAKYSACLLMMLLISSQAFSQVASTHPWVNEIHYDNDGTDVGEFIEIAGPAGQDLSLYQLVLYNGGNSFVYNTINLTGTIDDEGAGIGAINFPIVGIQDGSPDGMAIVEVATSTVIQFLSYEGPLTALNGPAAGMTSIDIGVKEGASANVGESLQLTGMGCNYASFTWTGPLAESPGSLNAGQSCAIPNLPPTSTCADPIVVNDNNQPAPNIPSAGWASIPANGMLSIMLGFPGGTTATIDLNCLSDDNDQVGELEIRLASSTILPGGVYVLENVYDIRDSEGAESLELIRIQLTAGNQPPSAGMARTGVVLPTSGGAACPANALVSASIGDIFSIDDVIMVAGLGVPVPTSIEVSDDTDLPSELSVEITNIVNTPSQCTTTVAITYVVSDTEGAVSDPRTDTFIIIDDTAPVLNTSTIVGNSSIALGFCPSDVVSEITAQLPIGVPTAPGTPLFSSTSPMGSASFPFTTFFVENCSDEQTGVTITASNLAFSAVGCNEVVASWEYTFEDECGNSSMASVSITYTQSSSSVLLPLLPQQATTTSAGADCLNPFASVSVGDMIAPGGSVVVSGKTIDLPDLSEIQGCLGANPSFEVVAVSSNAIGDPCVTINTISFAFSSDCGQVPPIPFQATVEVVDDSPPVLSVPADISISCDQNPQDLTITGQAFGTDNCSPFILIPLIASGQIFINEIHYDNDGGDVNEGIEVAGPAGTNLSGYTLQPYNGSNGTPYSLTTLSGIIPDEGAGFGALFFPISDLQNGAPDGIALCGPMGVIEFLSYEGAFTAVGGCAAGTVSTDIGVSEIGSTPVGLSLQRVGMGTNGSDFTWTGPTSASSNQLNLGQTFSTGGGGGPTGPGGVVPVTFTDVIIPGVCDNSYTIERTFSATDACGLVTEGTQLITVTDAEGPVITNMPGSLNTGTIKSSLVALSLSTGDCADDVDLVAFAALIESQLNDPQSFLTIDENCSASVVVEVTAQLAAGSNSCEAVVEFEVVAIDDCGNASVDPFLITITIIGDVGATLPVPGAPTALFTSLGASCLDPLGAIMIGQVIPVGGSVLVAGTPIQLPTAAEIGGCFGPNASFTVGSIGSSVGSNPCVTSLSVDFTFDSDCGTAPTQPFTLSVNLTDDTAPVVTAPGPIMISCDQDIDDLGITGMAIATDNCAPGGPPALVSSIPVFINEIHYDNPGADVNEFIEIAGPAGTDLSGYSIELVNGSNGTVYETINLSGVLVDQQDGYGAIAFFPSTIQNGSPDGVALCGPTGIIEFLSYEGSFAADAMNGGCAAGLTSTDIGVTEDFPAFAIGLSLQRIGAGLNGNDFAFVGPVAESPGMINVNQFFATGGGGNGGPVSTTYTDSAPIVGSCAGNFSIQRTFEATDACGNVGTALQIISVSDMEAPVFAQAPGELDNTITTTQLAAAGLGNCAVALNLADLELSIVFAQLFGQTNYLGFFDFPTASDNCTGASVQVSGVGTGVVSGMAPCSAELIISFIAIDGCGNSSTYDITLTIVDDEAPVVEPGFEIDFVFSCDEPFDMSVTGMPVFTDNCGSSEPSAPAIWINEFHYDNVSTDVGEFIEIAGSAGFDLAGYSLVVYNGNGGGVYGTMMLSGIIPNEGAGGGAINFPYPVNGLQNGSPDGIALVDPSGTVVEFLSYEGTMTATDGPAAGQTSVDVGVLEPSDSPIGQSLQRRGAGDQGGRFTFAGPAPASPGALNAGQFFLSSQTVTVSFSESSVPDPNCPNGQTITRTFTASDGCGNSEVVVQTIVVIDTEAPEYTFFPRDTTVECSSLAGMSNMQLEVSVVANGQGLPTVEDDCTDGLVATFTDVFTLSTSCPTVGVFERIFDAVDDGCGNILPSRTLTITVIDTSAPVFTFVPMGGDVDCADGVPPTGQVTAVDCDPDVAIVEVDETEIVGENQVVSIVTRTITATDACGNSSSRELVFRVLDTEDPVAVVCPIDIGPLVADPDDRLVVNFPTPQFTDNCGFSVSGDVISGTSLPVGLTTVTYTAIDEGGNRTICSFTIEIVKALNIACTTGDISVADPADFSIADINFPYATTTCDECPQGDLANLDYLGYFRGHRYFVSKPGQALTWLEANDYAISLGGRLVQIDNAAENLFIQRELPYAEASIGLYAEDGPGDWVWTFDDNNVGFDNWAPGSPANDPLLPFGIIRSSDGLHVDVDQSQRPYIIEFNCIDFEVLGASSTGTYPVGLNAIEFVAVDQCGNRDTCDYTFRISTFDVLYCTPTELDYDSPGEDEYAITAVSVGAFAKTFSAGDSYYNLRDTVRLNEDEATPLSFTGTSSGADATDFPAYWRVWVDANRDGDFYEAGELIFEGFGDASITNSLTLPSSLATLSPTRLRVGMNRYEFPEPCGAAPFGDYKDFSLVSNTVRAPRLSLRGTVSRNVPQLTVDSEEDSQVASYIMLRGDSEDDLSKYFDFVAMYQDGQQHSYQNVDNDPLLSAYYQAIALDRQGYIIRQSNVIKLSLVGRRGPINCYPNPVRNHMVVDVPGEAPANDGTLDIFDAIGRQVLRQEWPAGTNRVDVQLPSLPTGTYMLRISHPNVEPLTKRIIVDQGGNLIAPRA